MLLMYRVLLSNTHWHFATHVAVWFKYRRRHLRPRATNQREESPLGRRQTSEYSLLVVDGEDALSGANTIKPLGNVEAFEATCKHLSPIGITVPFIVIFSSCWCRRRSSELL